MNLSIVIAYKPDGGLRDKHLAWTVARYEKMFQGVEIIISQDEISEGKDWQGFCKSKYINTGVARSRNEIVLITDCDILLEKQSILEAIKQIDRYCCILPYNCLYKLSNGTSNRILSQKPDIKMPFVNIVKQKKVVIPKNKPQGIHIIKKADYIEAGGYDERFIGWGSEDSAFQIACRTMLEKPIGYMAYNAYHLKHPIVKNRQQERNDRVGDILQKYRAALNNKEEMNKVITARVQWKH